MKPVLLFDTLSQSNKWLSQRQSVVAQNVANVSTPGFKALDVMPFSEVFNGASMQMARTDQAHLAIDDEAAVAAERDEQSPGDVLHSGNSVSLEREFAKSGDIGRAYALNTGIMKSFSRMLQLSIKS